MSLPSERAGFETPVRSSRARSTLLIVLIAAVALAPELLIGLTVTDNYRFNLTWPEQFNELFRSGHAYPRWLPRAWDGFGSPAGSISPTAV